MFFVTYILHYSGKFPSLKRLYSVYGGKFLQEHLYIKLKVGAFPPRHFLPKLYPPLCQVSCTKNQTKLYGFLVCNRRRWVPGSLTPAKSCQVGTPQQSQQDQSTSNKQNLFSSTRKKLLSVRLWLTLNCIVNINLFTMKNQLPTLSALVSIHPCKSQDFLYVIKNVSSDTWLPRIPKAVVKDSIKTKGLYTILYRLYTNEKGYESIFITSATKIKTE